jgi:hypothetical protein
MYIPFETLPNHSKIWIYQADRILNPEEVALTEKKALEFTDQWAAHGSPLQASFKILHQRFLVLAVNETFNQASGCSIDSSVNFIKNLEHLFGVNFFDRTKVAFIHNHEVFIETLANLKNSIREGKINANTLTFNNLVQNKEEFENQWVIPASASWVKRYF